MRPATILSSGRTLWSCKPTPRKVTFESLPVSILGRLTTVMISGESTALASASLARPGAFAIVSRSLRVKLLLSSASDPPRSTMTRSGRPLSAMVWRNPVAMASTETRTATTPAMPITITLEEPARCGRVCMPIEVKAMSCLNIVLRARLALLHESIDHVQAHRAQRRRGADQERKQYREADAAGHQPRRSHDALKDAADHRNQAIARGEA